MRRRSFLACVAMVVATALGVAGCSGASGPLPQPPKPLAMATVNDLAAQLQLPPLKGQRLTAYGDFGLEDFHFTVAATTGRSLPKSVTVAQIKSGLIELGKLGREQLFPVTLSVSSGESAELLFSATPMRQPRRFLVFTPPDGLFPRLRRERKQPETVWAFTAYRSDPKVPYEASFVADVGPHQAAYGQEAVDITRANTYVEACQSRLEVALDPEFVAKLKQQPVWAQVLANPRTQAGFNRAGQEGVCNGLGFAMAAARSGLAYRIYRSVAKAARVMVETLRASLAVVDEGVYDGMR